MAFHEGGRIDIELNKEEVSALFTLLVRGRKAKNLLFGLSNGFLENPISGAELRDLKQDAANADSAKNRLIGIFISDNGLVNTVVNSVLPPKNFFGRKYDDIREELFAEACLLLDRALGEYNPEYSAFNTFFTNFSSGTLREKCAKLTNPTWTRGTADGAEVVDTLMEPSKIENIPIPVKKAESDPLMALLTRYHVIVNGCLNDRSPILIEAGLNAREKMVLETTIHGNWGARTLNIQQIARSCGINRVSVTENSKSAIRKIRLVLERYSSQGL